MNPSMNQIHRIRHTLTVLAEMVIGGAFIGGLIWLVIFFDGMLEGLR